MTEKQRFPPNLTFRVSGSKTYHAFRDCRHLSNVDDDRVERRLTGMEKRFGGVPGEPCGHCMTRWANGDRPENWNE